MSFNLSTTADVFSNARIKHYPLFDILQVSNYDIFRAPGFEEIKIEREYDVPSKGHAKDSERSLEKSLSRARAAIRDIVLCNHFEYFFTWTLDANMIDRYDVDTVKKKLLTFLKHKTSRNGFEYICVAEKHKDGAIHFHGLCHLGTVKIERAINPHTDIELFTERDQPIFNMIDWKYGFSTCIPLDENYERTCNYILKYISKGSEKIFGKWYYSSRNLQKKPPSENVHGIDYNQFSEENPDVPEISLYNDVKLKSKKLQSPTYQ